MGSAILQKDVFDYTPRDADEARLTESDLERLFKLYTQIETVLADCGEDDEKITGLLEAQTVIMRTASVVRASTMQDLLYKLAMWRWDAPGLDTPVDEMSRSDAIAYSAFRDLVKNLNATQVLKDFDKTN